MFLYRFFIYRLFFSIIGFSSTGFSSTIFYSKERSGDRAHGGEHWKQFVEKDGELIHEADVDMTGKIMNKHKGTIGMKIKIKDLIRMNI